MTRGEKIKFIILRSIGNFLLLFSIYGVVATFGPSLLHEVRFRIQEARGIEYAVQASGDTDGSGGGFGEILAGQKEQVLIPTDTNFSIVIPKLGATAKVYPNVDPENEEEFLQYLRTGVAHAKGSVFPGLSGNTYLFAHSTDNWWNVGRYNAVFYLLKDLKKGDDVVVFFENTRHNYVVDSSFIADPTDVSLLQNSQTSSEQRLVLQTCWPPGTTWKRLFVIAKPKGQ